MGWIIVIMLAFIAPAFWSPDEVRRVVSSLSAVLLSLTFVFSNTIREARSLLLSVRCSTAKCGHCSGRDISRNVDEG